MRASALRIAGWMLACLWLGCATLKAEPYIALETAFKCSQCHVNPTGGGLRSIYGDVFAQAAMPAAHLDTGTGTWTGALNSFARLGGDLRFEFSSTQVPHSRTLTQADLEQMRTYLEADVIPGRLTVYADEQVAPGGALNREAWVMYQSADHDWYLKAGQIYLPFGWRLQDQTAFVEQVSGINMTTPDQGAEFGWLHGHWDAQLTVSNGTAGGTVTDSRKQYGSQLAYVESGWRVGVAVNYNDKLAGAFATWGAFAGIRTGPVVWLGEADVADNRGAATGQGRTAGLLGEADWLIVRGSNLKFTAEFLDPDQGVPHNGQTRWSVIYELTPIQFLQLRTGLRYSDGIPQNDAQHTRLYFVELHGFF